MLDVGSQDVSDVIDCAASSKPGWFVQAWSRQDKSAIYGTTRHVYLMPKGPARQAPGDCPGLH